MATLEFAEKSKKLSEIKSRAKSIMEKNDRYKLVLEKIQDDLNQKDEDDKLRITFVGQYSSGKSTIISTLTGDEGIEIGSDIVTSKTTASEWRDVVLVDTPGLYTQHTEHDDIAKNAIKQADILVYCLTASLFDNLLLNDFLKLAYEQAYSSKMFLVINKMDLEYGKYDELVNNYKKSLIKALGEERLSKFPCSFIAAQQQRDSDPDVQKESHFEDFIFELNNFIEKNGQMGKLFSTANIFIYNILQGIIENNDDKNKELFIIIERVEKLFQKKEREGESFFNSHIDELESKIVNAGYNFVNKNASDETEAAENSKIVENELKQYCEAFSQDLEKKINEILEELNEGSKEILDSELCKNFCISNEIVIDKIDSGNILNKNNSINSERVQQLFSLINNAASKVSDLAMGPKVEAGAGLLFKKSEVSGSQLHKTVLDVGHIFGKKYHSYEAINITQKIGNFSEILGKISGPLSTIVTGGLEYYNEKQRENAEKAKRTNILIEFSKEKDSVTEQFRKVYNKYKEQFNKLQKEIKKIKEQRIDDIKLTDETAKELKLCIAEFQEVLGQA